MSGSIQKFNGPAGHRKRLRERFLRTGRDALADYELLELLVTYSIPRIDTKPIAKALLNRFGSIFSVFQQPIERLLEIKGVGPQTATLIRVVQACLARSMEKVVEQQNTISKPEDIFAFIRLHLGQHTNECIFAFYLDDTRRIVHQTEVSIGTVDRTPFYPREILKPALIHNATGLILAHNHPEGEPVPSEADLKMTKRLEDVADPLGIKLLDHMIVTRLQAYSIKTGKLL
jgi:DNA repair protein RadC